MKKVCLAGGAAFALEFARLSVTDTIKSYFKEYGGLTLLPPLVTLILGLLVAWVASGFKGAKQPSDLEGNQNKSRARSGNAGE